MSLEAIAIIEERIGCALPTAYRAFLEHHSARYLLPNWLLRTSDTIPGGGPEEVLRSLASAAQLLEQDLVGEVSEGMLVVGEIEPGGYLYLSVGGNRHGAFFVRFPFQDPKFYFAAADFEDLIARSRPDDEL